MTLFFAKKNNRFPEVGCTKFTLLMHAKITQWLFWVGKRVAPPEHHERCMYTPISLTDDVLVGLIEGQTT
jgi:hypothetical protein